METKEKGEKKTHPLKPDLSFEKEERLARQSDFKAVLDRGSTVRLQGVRLLYHSKQEGASRLGIWVSKKDFKRAVERNRLKRWVREFFRKNKSRIRRSDLIVQVNKNPEAHGELDKILEKAFEKAQLLK